MVFHIRLSWLHWWMICYTTWIIIVRLISSSWILQKHFHVRISYQNAPAMVSLETFFNGLKCGWPTELNRSCWTVCLELMSQLNLEYPRYTFRPIMFVITLINIDSYSGQQNIVVIVSLCLLYRVIQCEKDIANMQSNLNSLAQ